MAIVFQHEVLAKARVDLGLTQEEAARAVGVDVRTYRRYESGEVNESGSFELQRASRRQLLERLCRELGLAEQELLRDDAVLRAETGDLPRAPHFVGRALELAELTDWLDTPRSRLRAVALIAMGGAGKTSLAEQVLRRSRARTALVHSFYEEPSVDTFLARAAAALNGPGRDPLEQVLSGLRHHPEVLLVLDGLERVQANGEDGRARGELLDKRLLRLFRAMLREAELGRLLVTSRFSLVDLLAFSGDSLRELALRPLDGAETAELLRRWGLSASVASLERVYERSGGHALSVAMLGSYAAEILDGDVELALGAELSDAAREEPLARRLHDILNKYAAELSPFEREVLAHVCVFPRGVSLERLQQLPRLTPAAEASLRTALARLVRRGLAVPLPGRYSAHPLIREHFSALLTDAPGLHAAERARLAAQLATELAEQPQQRPRDERLLDLFEALFEHSVAAGDIADAHAVLSGSLGGFSHLGLRLGQMERGLRMTRALQAHAQVLAPAARWRLTYERGLYSAALGDLDDALRAYRILLAANEIDATTHRTLAYTLRLRGDWEAAHGHVARSIVLSRAEGPGSVARGLALQGAIFTAQGKLDEAHRAFDQVHALGDAPTARRSIWEAEYLLARGEPQRAETLTRDNLLECEQRGWAGHVAHCHVILGRVAVTNGDLPGAEAALAAAQRWCEQSREVELTLWADLLEVELARSASNIARASAARQRCHDIASAGGYGLVLGVLKSL